MVSTPDDPTGTTDQHRLTVLIGRVRDRLAVESGASLWSLPEAELVGLLAEVHALAGQLDAVRLAVLREADRRDLAKTAGATSTGNWLSGMVRVRPEEASRSVKLARDLDTNLPLTELALRAGELSTDHAHVIARAIRDLPAEAGPEIRAEAEQVLVEHARRFHPKDLARLGRTVLNAVDPDLADEVLAKQLADQEAKANRDRHLSLSDDPHGTGTFIRGKLDPLTADMLRTALEPLAAPLPTTADGPDLRTRPQRLADGFAELIRRYLDSGTSPTHAAEKPHVIITIDWNDLTNRTGAGSLLGTGTLISARTAQEWACDATISWYGATDGEVTLKDGSRLFVGKLRRLLELRDRGCAFPGCDRPPAWCHAHHIIPWSKGGPTTLANGVLLCGYHHRLIHRRAWTIRMAADGHPDFIPPDWIDEQRKPIRNQKLRT